MKLELYEPEMTKKKQEREREREKRGLKTEDLRSKTEEKKQEKSANQQRIEKDITEPKEYMYKCVYFRCIKKEEKIEKRSR